MPRDLTEPTFCGALGKLNLFFFLPNNFLVSIICTFILIGLTVYEVQAFLNTESQAELVIDTSHRDDFVNVNIDVVFPNMPCDIISLDQQDIMGIQPIKVMLWEKSYSNIDFQARAKLLALNNKVRRMVIVVRSKNV